PLGTRWMGLSAPGVGIHGTDDPSSIGYSVSHGCIRMQVPDAEWLFEHVKIGTTVVIVLAVRRLPHGVAVAVVVGLLGVLVWDVAHNHAGRVAKEVDSGHAYAAPSFTRPFVNRKGKLRFAS